MYLNNIELYKLKYFNNWKNKYQLKLIISVSILNYYYRNHKKNKIIDNIKKIFYNIIFIFYNH